MKSISMQTITRKLFFAFAASIMIFYVSSCARKISFEDSSVVPGASGTVKVKKDKNNNYDIQISLSNLAKPDKLQPSKHSYVVWMETADNVTKNIGLINTSSGFLGGKLKSSFETVSPSKPTKIYLTAEDDVAVQFPGTQVILSTNNF